MEKVNVELTKDNALSLLGILELAKMDYKKANNQEIKNVIEEIKYSITKQVKEQTI